MRVVLLGMVHRDPGGYSRLTALLQELEPKVLTVEVSPFAIALRRRLGERWRELLMKRLALLASDIQKLPEHPQIAGIMQLIELPFEFRAARKFAESVGAPLYLLDDSARSREYLSLVEDELITLDNLRVLIATTPPSLYDQVAREYQRAHTMLSRGNIGQITPRERQIAGRLESIILSFEELYAQTDGDDVCLVHIGGWEHLPSLVQLLNSFDPQVSLGDTIMVDTCKPDCPR